MIANSLLSKLLQLFFFLSSFHNSLRSVLDHYTFGKQIYHQLDERPDGAACLTRILWYTIFCPLFLLYLPNRPPPLPEIEPQIIIFPPPCLTVGEMQSPMNRSPVRLPHINPFIIVPKSSNFDSLVHNTLFQTSLVQSLCSLANARRLFLFFPYEKLLNSCPTK